MTVVALSTSHQRAANVMRQQIDEARTIEAVTAIMTSLTALNVLPLLSDDEREALRSYGHERLYELGWPKPKTATVAS